MKSGRLIPDILELSNSLNIDGFLLTVYFEKAFNSVNFGFKSNLIGLNSNLINYSRIVL